MAEKFQTLGYTFETIDGKDNEVALCAVDKNASGKIILPKMVEHNGENCTVSKIACHSTSCWDKGIIYLSQVTDVVVPSTIRELGGRAFYDCYYLTTIKLPNELQAIGFAAFSQCNKLASIEIPSSVKIIGGSAFKDCESLSKIEIPSSVKKINDDTFYKCKSLTKIEIPSSVEIIGEWAFASCDKLTQVDIYNDEGEVTIAANAFPSCAKINYLGKKGAQKAAAPEMAANLSPKHTEEKKDSSPKPDKVKETAASLPTKKNEVSVPKPTKSVQEIKEEPNASSKLANEAQNDYKKSAEFKDYIINITEDKKVIVTKDGEVCEVTKVALREIAGKTGFNYDSEWTTQQFGRKLVAFLNEK